MSFRVETIGTFTCNRCKKELQITISPPVGTIAPLDEELIKTGLLSEEDSYEASCRDKSTVELSKHGWMPVFFQKKSFDLCPECSSDLSSFLESLESFTPSEGTCCLFDEYCIDHGFHHGAEASELREGIEKLIKHPDPCGHSCVESLQSLLEAVDARDSLAYEEHAKQEKGPR